MQISLLAFASLLAAPAAAFWRLPCKAPVVVERADPIISPGQVSGHLHTIMGGNAFDLSMNDDSPSSSTCSSCTVQGDNSNYWTPVLFYRNQDGTFEKVDQIGGATVYYLQRSAAGETIGAFPKGFRMLAGDPFKRSAGTDAKSQAISYNCLDYNKKGTPNPETGGFPNYNCPDGLRAQVFFPSCWNGKDKDSSDHMSHMSYPDGAYNAGTCPGSHPYRLISLFYEIIWDTNKYAGKWYGNSQPFVWSMGDPTGYGAHGDFLNGWDDTLLKSAIKDCTNDSGRVEDCSHFTLTKDDVASACKATNKLSEQITGKLTAMPGCNPVQNGPDRATVTTGCSGTTPSVGGGNSSSTSASASTSNSASTSKTMASTRANTKATTTTTTTEAPTPTPTDDDNSSTTNAPQPTRNPSSGQEPSYPDLTSQGWAYAGCATDNYYTRSMKEATDLTDSMTNEMCTTFCEKRGYKFAGTEYARECYCGNSFPSDRLPGSGVLSKCDMPCKGNSSQVCGGAAWLSLYIKCEGGKECVNAVLGMGSSGMTTAKSAVPTTAKTTVASSTTTTTTTSLLARAVRWTVLPRSAEETPAPVVNGHMLVHHDQHRRDCWRRGGHGDLHRRRVGMAC